MGGNIPGRNFSGGNFPPGGGGEFTKGEFDLWKFSEWQFSCYWRKYMRRILKCTCIGIDLHQENLHSPNPQPPCLVPTNNNFFPKWCWNISSSLSATDWSCKCPYWVQRDVNLSSQM